VREKGRMCVEENVCEKKTKREGESVCTSVDGRAYESMCVCVCLEACACACVCVQSL